MQEHRNNFKIRGEKGEGGWGDGGIRKRPSEEHSQSVYFYRCYESFEPVDLF